LKAAPPVSVRAGDGVAWRIVLALLPALAAGAFAAWLLALAGQAAWPAWAVALLAGSLAGWRWRPAAVALAWDGQRWHADGTPGRVHAAIDLGGWMLLKLTPEAPGPVRWIAVSPREAGASMPALRAAVYSPSAPTARPEAGPTGLPPA
jgi:hypothetical protein